MLGKLLPKDRLLVAAPEPVKRKRFNELFDKADSLEYKVAPFYDRQAKMSEQAGDKEQQEYLLRRAEECRKEAAARRAYACEHFGEKF